MIKLAIGGKLLCSVGNNVVVEQCFYNIFMQHIARAFLGGWGGMVFVPLWNCGLSWSISIFEQIICFFFLGRGGPAGSIIAMISTQLFLSFFLKKNNDKHASKHALSTFTWGLKGLIYVFQHFHLNILTSSYIIYINCCRRFQGHDLVFLWFIAVLIFGGNTYT